MEAFHNGLNPSSWAARVHAATSAGDLAELRALLNQGKAIREGRSSASGGGKSDTNLKSSVMWSPNAPDIDLYSPLHKAVQKGQMGACEVLVDEFGADVNVSHPGLDGWTPLHISCWDGGAGEGGGAQVEICQFLLDRGADVWALDWYAQRPGQLVERGQESRDNEGKKESRAATQDFRAKMLAMVEKQQGGGSGSTNGNGTVNTQHKASPPADDAWAKQNLVNDSSAAPSDIQARMIEFSLKHCRDNDIGGEWQG